MDNRMEEMKQLKEDYAAMNIPKDGPAKIEAAIQRAKHTKRIRRIWTRGAGLAAAAAAAALLILPNASADIAMAMEKLPVIGSIVRVVTFNRYEKQNDNFEANIDVPEISLEDTGNETSGELSDSVSRLNKDIKEYTDLLIKQFETDMEELKGGHESMDVTYKVVTDNEDLFTLRITTTQNLGSSDEQNRYYHLDKNTGKVITLKDLFIDNSDYVSVLSKEIRHQMETQMAADDRIAYNIDPEIDGDLSFNKINEDQNFYFNENHQLVITFNKYDVSPGYMGCPEFVISREIISSILK